MRILTLDRRTGVIRLSLQTLEDLWHVHKLVEPGDLVRSKTYRKVAVKRGSEVMEGEKKPVLLTLRLEKSDFHPYTGKLRLSGIIVSGPEDIQLASHHTITIDPGHLLSIKKKTIRPYQIERLEKAKVKEQNIFFVCLDRDQADFGLLGGMGLELRGMVTCRKTEDQDDRTAYYQRIRETIELQKDADKVVLCGPGFERDNMLKFLQKHYPSIATRCQSEHAHETGKVGMEEVIRDAGPKIMKDSRVTRETGLLKELLIRTRKGELAVHGKANVEQALTYGAVETLLASEARLKEWEPLLDHAEKIGSHIAIIGTDHTAGDQLEGLGGIAALLRFRI